MVHLDVKKVGRIPDRSRSGTSTTTTTDHTAEPVAGRHHRDFGTASPTSNPDTTSRDQSGKADHDGRRDAVCEPSGQIPTNSHHPHSEDGCGGDRSSPGVPKRDVDAVAHV